MEDQARRNLAYVLRIWISTSRDGQHTWRVLLEEVHSGERHGFTTIRQLAAFLEERTEDAVRFPHAPPGAGDEP